MREGVMAEILTATVPGQFEVRRLLLDLDRQLIEIVIRENGGSGHRLFTYEGSTAVTLILALNKANLSITSLQRRILERLVADGKLTGTVSGTPD